MCFQNASLQTGTVKTHNVFLGLGSRQPLATVQVLPDLTPKFYDLMSRGRAIVISLPAT